MWTDSKVNTDPWPVVAWSRVPVDGTSTVPPWWDQQQQQGKGREYKCNQNMEPALGSHSVANMRFLIWERAQVHWWQEEQRTAELQGCMVKEASAQFPVAQLLCISCSHAVASQGENKVLFLLSWAHREIREKQRYPLHGNSKLESHEVHFEKHKPKGMRNEHLAQRWNCGWTNQARLSHSGNTLINGENNHHIFMLSFTTELSRRYISIQVCSQFNVTTTQIFYWEERKL